MLLPASRRAALWGGTRGRQSAGDSWQLKLQGPPPPGEGRKPGFGAALPNPRG